VLWLVEGIHGGPSPADLARLRALVATRDAVRYAGLSRDPALAVMHRLAVDATWAVTREVAVRAMIPQRSGVIFFMAFSPRRGIPSMVHATSARAALENLASGLALEWSRFGIRTICIAPGTIATEGMEGNYSADERARWEAAVPLGRLGTAEDVSGVIAFLASPAARYVTGTTILIDGGADAWGTGQPVPPMEQQP